jgi:hypothetical protein
MDDRQFDDLSRRVGESPLSRLPRRGLIAALGGATLVTALHLEDESEAKKKKNKNKNKKCKKEGKKCDKKKCKKKDKKCCCSNLKCKDSICTGKGGSCPTDVDFVDDWGSFGDGNGEFNSPWGITYDDDGFVYVTDTNNQRVQIFSSGGNFQDEFGTEGNEDEDFQSPQGIAWLTNSDGNPRLAIADPGITSTARRLRLFRATSPFSDDDNIGRSTLTDPTGVAVDNNDRIWAVDTTSPGEVYLFDSGGNFITSWTPAGSGQLASPQGIAVYRDSQNGANYVYVTDTNNDRVVKYQYNDNSSSGLAFVDAAGSTGTGSSSFNRPVGIAVDGCGNLWVTDRNNNRVQILDKNLNFKSRFSTNPAMNRPTGIAVNGSTLYVVNNAGNNVQRFSLS